jgi:predicted restriction endonuclease
VRYDYCKAHHVVWWRHGGLTDLSNLAPLCERHHHEVHDGGWVLQLAADRSLTVRLPDGQILTTGPPRRRAA